MSHDPTDGAGSGAFAPDNARQMIETASAFAQREMLPEARQALQRARNALAQRSDVGPAHWCNACLVALEIAARGGDVQGMEAEAAQLRSLSGGGQYWSEQARVRVGKSSGRVDPARLDRVFAVLAGTAAPSTPAPASAPPAGDPAPAFRVSAEGMARGLIAPSARPAARPEPPRAEPAPGLLPARNEEPRPAPMAREDVPEPPSAPAHPAVAKEPPPAPWEHAPIIDAEAAPIARRETPAWNQAPAPAFRGPTPNAPEPPSAPAFWEQFPAPAVREPAPPVREPAPVAREQAPAIHESAPTAHETTAREQAPAAREPAPAHEPAVREPAPVLRESAPAPTAWNPAPAQPPRAADPALPAEPTGHAAERAPEAERAFRGTAWGGAAWASSAPEEPAADRLPSESVSASTPEGDPAFYLPDDSGDEWMDRLAELADISDDDLPLIFVHDEGGDAGPTDARLRVTPDRTDAEELLRSFVDHMTRWRDDVSDEEAENFYDLGTSFLDMEQWESAVKVFDQAMRNPGTRVAAAEGYLKALIGMGDHHAAFGAAGMALSNLASAGEPLSGILFLRGQAAEQIGDPREARRCYQEALLIDRFFADARERLAALGE